MLRTYLAALWSHHGRIPHPALQTKNCAQGSSMSPRSSSLRRGTRPRPPTRSPRPVRSARRRSTGSFQPRSSCCRMSLPPTCGPRPKTRRPCTHAPTYRHANASHLSWTSRCGRTSCAPSPWSSRTYSAQHRMYGMCSCCGDRRGINDSATSLPRVCCSRSYAPS